MERKITQIIPDKPWESIPGKKGSLDTISTTDEIAKEFFLQGTSQVTTGLSTHCPFSEEAACDN